MNTEQIIIALSICGSLVIFDAIFLGIILFTRRKVTTASTWPSILGTVTESRIQMRSNSEGGRTSYPLVHSLYLSGHGAFLSVSKRHARDGRRRFRGA